MQKGRPCLSVAVVVFFGLFGWLVGSSAYVRFCFSLFLRSNGSQMFGLVEQMA